MDSNENEYSMVEQVASWAQKIIGPVVVAGVLGVFAAGLFTRDLVRELNSRVLVLEKWSEKTESNRYKKSDGVLEQITRATTDKLHDDKMRALEAENVRIWTAIRDHLSIGEHKGADYRITPLEEHIKDRRIHNGN